MEQNQPNPFHSTTLIRYQIPQTPFNKGGKGDFTFIKGGKGDFTFIKSGTEGGFSRDTEDDSAPVSSGSLPNTPRKDLLPLYVTHYVKGEIPQPPCLTGRQALSKGARGILPLSKGVGGFETAGTFPMEWEASLVYCIIE